MLERDTVKRSSIIVIEINWAGIQYLLSSMALQCFKKKLTRPSLLKVIFAFARRFLPENKVNKQKRCGDIETNRKAHWCELPYLVKATESAYCPLEASDVHPVLMDLWQTRPRAAFWYVHLLQ